MIVSVCCELQFVGCGGLIDSGEEGAVGRQGGVVFGALDGKARSGQRPDGAGIVQRDWNGSVGEVEDGEDVLGAMAADETDERFVEWERLQRSIEQRGL